MLNEIALGMLMVAITTITHALFMIASKQLVGWVHYSSGARPGHIKQALWISVLVLWMFLAIVLEVSFWALLYVQIPAVGELPDLETALYFSMVTFTTVGYGDVVLTGNWRLLASIQAANGVIIFGWTTALIFYFIQHIYENK